MAETNPEYVPSWAPRQPVVACIHPDDALHEEAGGAGWCWCPCPRCYAATHPHDTDFHPGGICYVALQSIANGSLGACVAV